MFFCTLIHFFLLDPDLKRFFYLLYVKNLTSCYYPARVIVLFDAGQCPGR